jgi:hypothetical protein
MFEFCRYHMILMWQVSTMMSLKLVETSFEAWLQTQGVNNLLSYGHLTPCYIFQLKIIACILTSLNKLFMWSILAVHTKSKHFVTFNVIEKNMKWGFDVNSHVEDKLQ